MLGLGGNSLQGLQASLVVTTIEHGGGQPETIAYERGKALERFSCFGACTPRRHDGKQHAFLAEDGWTASTADKKLAVALSRKTGRLTVHDAGSGALLHTIPVGRWAAGAEAVNETIWDMHPWRHELALSMGAWGDPERAYVRILDLAEAAGIPVTTWAGPPPADNAWPTISLLPIDVPSSTD